MILKGLPGPAQTGSRDLIDLVCQLETDFRFANALPELQLLISDLEAHRAELEMQNEELRAAKARLEESRARYADLYDFAPVVYFTLDAQARILEANLAAASMLGLRRGEVMGRTLASIVAENDRPALREHLRQCFARRLRLSTELMIVIRGRPPLAVQVVSAPLLDAAGAISGCRTALIDVSALRRARERLAFLAYASTVLTSSFAFEEALAAVAEAAVPAYADVCFIDLCEPGQTLRRTAATFADPRRELVAEARRSMLRPLSDASPAGCVLRTGAPVFLPTVDLETLSWGHDGYQHEPLLKSCSPTSLMFLPLVARGGPVGVLTFISTDRKREFNEDDLEFASDLAIRLGTAVEQGRLHLETERAVAAHRDLVSFVSHDLRSPLMGILFSAQALVESSPPEERRQGRRDLERIRRAALQMRKMVEDLLDVTSIDAGHLRTRIADNSLKTVLEAAVEMMAPHARRGGIELRLEALSGDQRIRCDHDRVLQVLSNVIGNALRFVPRGGTITLFTELERTESGMQVVVNVRDNGPGVPPERLPRLFERYWQASETAAGGRGLGLYIAKGIVEAQGGRIWCESEVGAGATFSFTIPIVAVPDQRPAT